MINTTENSTKKFKKILSLNSSEVSKDTHMKNSTKNLTEYSTKNMPENILENIKTSSPKIFSNNSSEELKKNHDDNLFENHYMNYTNKEPSDQNEDEINVATGEFHDLSI